MTSEQSLQQFIDQLRALGYEIITNWETTVNRSVLRHVTMKSDVGFSAAIFQIYPDGNGYDIYLQDKTTFVDESILNIQRTISDESKSY